MIDSLLRSDNGIGGGAESEGSLKQRGYFYRTVLFEFFYGHCVFLIAESCVVFTVNLIKPRVLLSPIGYRSLLNCCKVYINLQ